MWPAWRSACLLANSKAPWSYTDFYTRARLVAFSDSGNCDCCVCVRFSRWLVASVFSPASYLSQKFITRTSAHICLARTLCCTVVIQSPKFTSSTLYRWCVVRALSVIMQSRVQSEYLFVMPLDQHLYGSVKDWHLWDGYIILSRIALAVTHNVIFKLFSQLGVDRPWLFSGGVFRFCWGK